MLKKKNRKLKKGLPLVLRKIARKQKKGKSFDWQETEDLHLSKGLGTGPNTGPGTAPNTGPGTAPNTGPGTKLF